MIWKETPESQVHVYFEQYQEREISESVRSGSWGWGYKGTSSGCLIPA
jgi:hypothetical protein